MRHENKWEEKKLITMPMHTLVCFTAVPKALCCTLTGWKSQILSIYFMSNWSVWTYNMLLHQNDWFYEYIKYIACALFVWSKHLKCSIFVGVMVTNRIFFRLSHFMHTHIRIHSFCIQYKRAVLWNHQNVERAKFWHKKLCIFLNYDENNFG